MEPMVCPSVPSDTAAFPSATGIETFKRQRIAHLLKDGRNVLPSSEGVKRAQSRGRALAFPRAKKPANRNELTQVIGIVVGDKQGFAKNCLSRAVRNSRKEICLRTHNQLLHRSQITGK